MLMLRIKLNFALVTVIFLRFRILTMRKKDIFAVRFCMVLAAVCKIFTLAFNAGKKYCR
jgi:hypothetical protein